MPGFLERLDAFVEALGSGKLPLPQVVAIPPDQCPPPGSVGAEIRKEEAYFTVRINELFLAEARVAWANYDPMVLVTSSFVYGDKTFSVPAVVGPSLVAQPGQALPRGLLFNDTTAAGPYPYRGGPVTLSVVLYRVRHHDYARGLLRLLDGISKAIGPAADLGILSKVGGTMLDGLELLLGLGETEPVAGHRIELSPLRPGGFRSFYSVLIDAGTTSREALRVVDGRLHLVAADGSEEQFRAANYVLYSVETSDRRSDERTLPFYPIFERALKDAARGGQDAWKSAKATLAELWQQMILSPDLLPSQAEELLDTYRKQLVAAKERRDSLELMSPGTRPSESAAEESRTRRAASLLDM